MTNELNPFNFNNDDDPMNFGNFNDPMDNFFDDLGKSMFKAMPAMRDNMRTNVSDDGKAYHVTAELPGFKKNNIHLDYRNNTLRVLAKHNLGKEAKDEKGHVIRKEISNSNVARAFYLPHVQFNKISAGYDGGLLKVTLPKDAKSQDKGHQINIK